MDESARPQRVGADPPAKDSTSPLDLGLNHLHPFGEHRRPREGALDPRPQNCSPGGAKA